jgi:serine O-acetyltransferase
VPDRFSSLMRIIAEDYDAHGRQWTKPGFRAVAVHRFGAWRMTVRTKILRAPLSVIYRWAFRHCRNVYGIELPYTVALGRRVIFEHQGGIVIHGNSQIGDDCIIRQNCTLGIRSMNALDEAPILEQGVNVGAGAVILGAVRIGRQSAIGANAVVLTDVPKQSLAVGVPATIQALRPQPSDIASNTP